ncbi:helix-turn-helix domain-containing protein [Paenibacillus ehimensis]|uniref:helix-turn-helix domain-containing protein n=1 Tax=Paenibacillus ehimensis TaxID=79264 RepID=UPI00056B372A
MNRSLRLVIEDQMKQHGYNLNKVAELSGINVGNLSMALNGLSRSLTIKQLDALANVFGKAPGWLYELYTEECVSEGKVSRPRLIPYLVRCVEVGRKDCIDPVLAKILDHPKNALIIFPVAEKLFQKGKQQESARFYQLIADNMKDSFSEILAMSHYRLLLIAQGTDVEKNWKALIQFEPYRRRLPENYQPAALLKLAKICYSLEKWDEVEQFADELTRISLVSSELKSGEEVAVEHHKAFYLGAGLLFKGIALEKKELYEKAKKVVQDYAELESFLEPLDEAGRKEIERFKVLAKANLYTLEVLMGNGAVLNEYTEYLESLDHLNEILSGLTTILKAANRYDFCVDQILDRFSWAIGRFNSFDNDLINSGRHLWFRYQKALYEFKNERFREGINDSICCMSLSKKMNKHEDFVRCVSLFEKHRGQASHEQIVYYQSIAIREEM